LRFAWSLTDLPETSSHIDHRHTRTTDAAEPLLKHGLDRAICMINNGDITQGVHHASTVLLNLPTDFRPAIVIRRAHAVAAAVPPQRRSLAAVRSLHEVLAIETER
ncbi:hypothetical protein, partial [Actinoplanes flavus]